MQNSPKVSLLHSKNSGHPALPPLPHLLDQIDLRDTYSGWSNPFHSSCSRLTFEYFMMDAFGFPKKTLVGFRAYCRTT